MFTCCWCCCDRHVFVCVCVCVCVCERERERLHCKATIERALLMKKVFLFSPASVFSADPAKKFPLPSKSVFSSSFGTLAQKPELEQHTHLSVPA